MNFSIPLSCEIPLEQLREYLNEETLKGLSASNREVKVIVEKVLNVSITIGETRDGLVTTGRVETRIA